MLTSFPIASMSSGLSALEKRATGLLDESSISSTIGLLEAVFR